MYRDIIHVSTKSGKNRIITDQIKDIVNKSGIKDGLCNIFLKGTTASIFLNEDDRMLMADIEKMLDKVAPTDKIYHHQANAHSHLRSITTNSHLSIPVAEGKLFLGTWQSIIFWEWDIDDREREIIVTVVG